MPTLARMSFVVPPAQSGDFAALYDRQLLPLLHPHHPEAGFSDGRLVCPVEAAPATPSYNGHKGHSAENGYRSGSPRLQIRAMLNRSSSAHLIVARPGRR